MRVVISLAWFEGLGSDDGGGGFFCFCFVGNLDLGWLGSLPLHLLRCRSKFNINKLILRTHCLTNHRLWFLLGFLLYLLLIWFWAYFEKLLIAPIFTKVTPLSCVVSIDGAIPGTSIPTSRMIWVRAYQKEHDSSSLWGLICLWRLTSTNRRWL